jgi:ATP-dependent helicase HrpB
MELADRLKLPIDAKLTEIVATVSAHGAAVVVAEAGAGKTTRVPPAFLDAVAEHKKQVWVSEPRRIAARLAAKRVVAERGGRLGGEVGYEVRFDTRCGAQTRLCYMTEGILVRRLERVSDLADVTVVVLDEFHERSLQADLALSLLRRLQKTIRPDLKIVVMSATLQTDELAGFLEGPVFQVAGRLHPVEIRYAEPPKRRQDSKKLAARVAVAVAELGRMTATEDILVFLPGAADIRRAMAACERICARQGRDRVPLHGALDKAAQDRAVTPGPRPRVIFSTNVAETSITIPRVSAVIDSGLAKIATHNPWSGFSHLETRKISRASAAQRAGRAGRTRAGVCCRLYTKYDHEHRRTFDVPEIQRADLAELVLFLRAGGYGSPADFPFLTPPGRKALQAAEKLLVRLGAVEADGAVTAVGRKMRTWGVHPRLARMLWEIEQRSALLDPQATRRLRVWGAQAAAVLQEPDFKQRARVRFSGSSEAHGRGADVVAARSDLLDALDSLAALQAADSFAAGCRRRVVDVERTKAVFKAAAQILDRWDLAKTRLCAAGVRNHVGAREKGDDEILLIALLAGFPDRVVQRRAPQSDAVVFADGGAGRLVPESVVREGDLLVAFDVEEGKKGTVYVRRASEIEPEWLLELFPDAVQDREQYRFNERSEGVEKIERLVYGGLVLDEVRKTEVYGTQGGRVLAAAVREAGLDAVCDLERLRRWQNRVAFVARTIGQTAARDETKSARITLLPDDTVWELIDELCADCRSFAELRRSDVVGRVLDIHLGTALPTVRRLAPQTVAIAGRKKVTVHYEENRPPWIAARIQDFFGMRKTPAVGGGRIPLVLHLLAPNNRAVQVTTDLVSFWQNHYPAVRRSLSRRYHKHYWPADPTTAVPLPPGWRRRKNKKR